MEQQIDRPKVLADAKFAMSSEGDRPYYIGFGYGEHGHWIDLYYYHSNKTFELMQRHETTDGSVEEFPMFIDEKLFYTLMDEAFLCFSDRERLVSFLREKADRLEGKGDLTYFGYPKEKYADIANREIANE